MALGRILGSLGPLSGALGCSWAPLGRLLGVPGALLAVSGAPLGPLARLLGDLGFTLKGFRKGLGGDQDLKIIALSYFRELPHST